MKIHQNGHVAEISKILISVMIVSIYKAIQEIMNIYISKLRMANISHLVLSSKILLGMIGLVPMDGQYKVAFYFYFIFGEKITLK